MHFRYNFIGQNLILSILCFVGNRPWRSWRPRQLRRDLLEVPGSRRAARNN